MYSKVLRLHIYSLFFRLFSYIGYYRILRGVSSAPWPVSVDYPFYREHCEDVSPKPLIYPFPRLSLLVTVSLF